MPAGTALRGGHGNDTLEGGVGPDAPGRVSTSSRVARTATCSTPGRRTAYPDVVDCGEGRDRAVIRVGDIAVDCERVRVLRPVAPASSSSGERAGDDTLDCGEHVDDRDRAVLRPGDTAVNCERVRTLAR